MPVRIYLWLLAIILPTWAILLPIFRVYSEPGLRPLAPDSSAFQGDRFCMADHARLAVFPEPGLSNRFIVLFTLVINYLLLVSYRVVLLKLTKHGAS